jgi:hypothetical protein
MDVSGQHHALAALPSGRKCPDTHYIGDLVISRAGVKAGQREKCICRESNPSCAASSVVNTSTELFQFNINYIYLYFVTPKCLPHSEMFHMKGRFYSTFADKVERNCHFPAPGWNCMTHRQSLQGFPDTSQTIKSSSVALQPGSGLGLSYGFRDK